jgi:hypothetical protein
LLRANELWHREYADDGQTHYDKATTDQS